MGMAVQAFTVFLLASNILIQCLGYGSFGLHLPSVCGINPTLFDTPLHLSSVSSHTTAAVDHYVMATFCIFYMFLVLHHLSQSLYWLVSLGFSFSIAGNACDLPFYLQHLMNFSLLPWSLGNLCRTEVKWIHGSRSTLCFLCNSNRF